MRETTGIQQALLAWFDRHQRDLPWRRTYSPYHVWISEVMLQQTQMIRGVAYFQRWCRRFPDVARLAEASRDEVYKLWEGLGYYRRADNLLATALRLMAEHKGELPADYGQLRRLPGIGPYTAAAIMSLAFNEDYPVVDANVERVFSRLFDIPAPVKSSRAFIETKARALLPQGRSRLFNQALMELGALICTPKRPACPRCPLAPHCEARQQGTVAERPVRGPVKEPVRIRMATGIIVRDGRIFIQKRLADDVWGNLWEFPGGRLQEGETPEAALLREIGEETGFTVLGLTPITTVHHSYTIYRVTLHGFACCLAGPDLRPPRLTAAQEGRWIRPEEIEDYAFPAGHRMLIEHLRRHGGWQAVLGPCASPTAAHHR
ncbi:MAG: A/G-specific adenine glycosylase [Thermodesulfobacteriota bacterium]